MFDEALKMLSKLIISDLNNEWIYNETKYPQELIENKNNENSKEMVEQDENIILGGIQRNSNILTFR